MPAPFSFFPPKPAKKKYGPILVPNSTLLPRSALVPVDPKIKERRFDGSTNRNPAHGPVGAFAMGSNPGGIDVGAGGGYGNTSYGLSPYGESVSRKFSKNKKEKAMFEDLESRMPDSLYDRRPGIFYDRMPDLMPV